MQPFFYFHFFTIKTLVMAVDKYGRSQIEKKAKDYGYRPNSSGSGMTNSFNQIKFSSSGGSVNIGGTKYTSTSDALKSKKW